MTDIIRFERKKRRWGRRRKRFLGRPLRYWFIKYGVPLVLLVAFMLVNRILERPVESSVSVDATATISIIDGDTVRSNGQVYRLVGFDTPEIGDHARCERERTLAVAATERLRALVSSGEIVLQHVPCACRSGTEGTRACNYGRLCGILKADDRDVGAILISEGLAHPYDCSPHCPRRQSWCD
jgi:endonuclease YncB( thermonuclease family)